MAPLSGHLALLWDHLVNRAIHAEDTPAARLQHLLDDLDLLLATASDLLHSCAKVCEQDAPVVQSDKAFTVSVTVAEALTVQTGEWAIAVENQHWPAKFVKLFGTGGTQKQQNANIALEDKLEALGSISITKTETIEDTDPLWNAWGDTEDDDKDIMVEQEGDDEDPSLQKELRVVLERLPDETPAVPSDKMDFVIIDKMFYCSVPGCDLARVGFATLPDLKHHFDSTHSLVSTPKTISFKQESFDEDVDEVSGYQDEDSLEPTMIDDGQMGIDAGDDETWESEDSEIDDEKADESYVPSGQPKKTPKAPRESKEVAPKTAPRRNLILGDLPLGYVPKEGESRPPLTCHVCDFFCYSRMDLESHTKTQHPGVDPFKCDLCEFTGSKKRFLLAHIVSRHPSFSPYECEICGKKFTRKLFMDKHVQKHFKPAEERKPRKIVQKKIAKKRSAEDSNHVEDEDNANMEESNEENVKKKRAAPTRFVILGDLPLGVELKEGEERPPLRCHVCDFKCYSRMDLESHTKTQHPGFDPFKCDLCEFTSPRKALLIAHVTSKHPTFRPHQCKVSTKYFFLVKTIVLTCCYYFFLKQICGKKFARLLNLKMHRKTHDPKPPRGSREELLKPKEVVVDGVKMVREYKWQRLKGRKSKKEKKKPAAAPTEPVEPTEPRPPPSQKCHLCEFTCRNRMDLESHTKTQHPGCDPFKCSFCEFTTPLKRFLLAHERRHVKAFKCDVRRVNRKLYKTLRLFLCILDLRVEISVQAPFGNPHGQSRDRGHGHVSSLRKRIQVSEISYQALKVS